MNTKKKGDFFENKVYELLESKKISTFLDDNKNCKLYRKKSYFSPYRKGNIETDLSIELYYPGEEKYFILIIIECKNYGKTVSIDNIEEFSSKLLQVSAHKGIMFTTSSFSENGINFARSKGIALVRLSSEDEPIFDANRKEIFGSHRNVRYNLLQKIIQQSSLKYGDISCSYDDSMYDDLFLMLKHMRIVDRSPVKNEIEVPYLSYEAIEKEADDLLQKYYPSVLKIFQATPIAFIADEIRDKQDVNFIYDQDLGGEDANLILGKISFDPKTINISSVLADDVKRWRFTLAHEIGHLVLHSKIMAKEYMGGVDSQMNMENLFMRETEKRIELQANYFASCLLMPKKSFEIYVKSYFIKNDIRNSCLRVDDQRCNIEEYKKLINELTSMYEVSKSAARYRLLSLKLINEVSSSRLLGDLF